MTEPNYTVQVGDARDDRERILALWEQCGFASGDDARARYDWFYLGNPRGPGRIYLLWCGDQLVGALGAGTRCFAPGPGEVPLRAAVLVDFVVHPLHRSMFPALQLQRTAREQELRHVDLMYGLPEAKAVPIFKRLGAVRQFTSGSHVRVLRSGNYATRRLPRVAALPTRVLCWFVDRARLLPPWFVRRFRGLKAQWHSSLPEGLDEFWERCGAQPGRGTGERGQAYLDWRFAQVPRKGAMFLTLRRRQSGELVAYFVCRRDGLDLKVVDLLIADQGMGMAASLVALAMASWPLGVESVRVIFGGCPVTQAALVRAGFVLRDDRPCFLMQSANARSLPPHWWFTKADEDV